MHKRCYDEKHKGYRNYGDRGIKVCDEWHNIENFIKWCKTSGYKKGLQLDRIDNNKDYSPENCRFVTVQQNLCNRRNTIIKDGMFFDDWLKYLNLKSGIKIATLRSRYYYLRSYGYDNKDITEISIINYKSKAGQSITNPK